MTTQLIHQPRQSPCYIPTQRQQIYSLISRSSKQPLLVTRCYSFSGSVRRWWQTQRRPCAVCRQHACRRSLLPSLPLGRPCLSDMILRAWTSGPNLPAGVILTASGNVRCQTPLRAGAAAYIVQVPAGKPSTPLFHAAGQLLFDSDSRTLHNAARISRYLSVAALC